MQQLTLARQAEFQRYTKKTRREQFLEEMDAVMPWAELLALVEAHYSKGETGRKPVGLAIMLRVYFLQQWFALSDPGVEDALYESAVLRRFAGIDLGRAPAPDETTILNFRHLLEEHDLCGQMLDAVNHYLESRGIRITTGTIVDATIIHAPSSTKNEKKERDPTMHQTKKNHEWLCATFALANLYKNRRRLVKSNLRLAFWGRSVPAGGHGRPSTGFTNCPTYENALIHVLAEKYRRQTLVTRRFSEAP
jgi:hypothetical protein